MHRAGADDAPVGHDVEKGADVVQVGGALRSEAAFRTPADAEILLEEFEFADSSTRMCFMNPLSDMPCGAASTLTLLAPLPSASSGAPRRVGERGEHVIQYAAVCLVMLNHGDSVL